MDITVGQIYREKGVEPAGPAMHPQPANRFTIVGVNEDRVFTLADGPGQEPVDRDRATFEQNFELIPG